MQFRRFVLLIMFVMGLALAGSLGSLDAQNAGDSPFESSWCDSPVVIPLTNAVATTTTPANGVITARGATAVLSSRGPVIRMADRGSRVQVTLGQTLFHTQWLFGSIDTGDSVRADAFLGRARQLIDASSIRGSLTLSTEQVGRGLTADATLQPDSTGEIDVFVGATELLFTNEGDTAVDLVAVAGCPALDVSTRVISAPTWDPESQRFIAEHEVTFRNQLSNRRASALRSQLPNAASTVVDDVVVDLSIGADGFREAEIVSMSMSRELDRRQNIDFDGRRDTGLLSTPLQMSNSDEHRLRFTLAYEPNFDDASWSEGVDVPAPTINIRGQVDDVPVGVSALLRPAGAELDVSAGPSRLITPAPGLAVTHRHLREPTSNQNGVVSLSERITVSNTGDTAIDELVVRYPLAEMYGPGTVFTEFAGVASKGCVGSLSTSFDGGQRSVLVYDEAGLDVGEVCVVDVRASVLPGIVPTQAPREYEAAAVATARSGLRAVRDATAVRTTLTQDSRVALDLATTSVTNLENGQYRFEGSLTARNVGDQNISDLAARIDLTTTPSDTPTPTRVRFDSITGDEACAGARLPSLTSSGRTLTSDAELRPGASCTVSFVLVATPSAVLDGWTISASAEARGPRRLAAVISDDADELTLPEAPAIDSTISVDSITNHSNGNYTVVLTTTISNAGDTPLTSVTSSNDGAEVFGSAIRGSERTSDSCSRISALRPLPAASQSENSSCTIAHTFVIEPLQQLTGWEVSAASSATSTSTLAVASSAMTEEIAFTEAPALESTLVLSAIEKVDDTSVRIVLRGSLVNTGDIELRSVQAQLDLSAALHDAPVVIERLRVDGAQRSETFDGVSEHGLLTGGDEIDAGEQADWDVVLVATTGADSGPFTFEVTTDAMSPAAANVDVADVQVERTVPVIQLIDRVLTSTNNHDGTYEIEHLVSVRNVGEIDIPGVSVTTDFVRVFGEFFVGEMEVESTCGETVTPGAACSSIRRATLRPGSAVGPHQVAVGLSSTDSEQLQALVVDTPSSVFFDSRALTPLRFEERPSIELETSVSEVANNADGTYTVDYSASVKNTGDVPLYRVGLPNLVSGIYGRSIVDDVIITNSCADVRFSEPLGPEATCTRTQTVTVRPLEVLGPWTGTVGVTADSPSFATVFEDATFDSVTFTEQIVVDAVSSIRAETNNGNGTYNTVYDLTITNRSDVPLVDVLASDAGIDHGERRVDQVVLFDSCTGVSYRRPLLPGAECRIELNQLLRPGAELGPFDLATSVTGLSASSETSVITTNTNELTLTESPKLELGSRVVSVESVDSDRFRVVTNLVVENAGDIRVDDIALMLDLDEVFPEASHRIDGVISNDFVVEEAFAAGESLNLLAPDQSLRVGAQGTITLIVSIQPNGEVGPFVGELRATGTSPAQNDVSAVISAQVDLPSIAVAVIAQSVDNNRDGSYTVTTSYEVVNDGSTALEFVRLVEDLDAIYEGTIVRAISVESDELPVADLTDRRRGNDLIEWGAMLEAQSSAVVTTTVLVEPGNVLGPFIPIAKSSAISPAGTEVGAEGFAEEQLEFVEKPALRVSQRLIRRPEWSASGTFDVSFEIEVVNDGDVELRSLQVREDLLSALGADSTIIVTGVRSETLAVNTGFDGLGQLPRSVEPTEVDEVDTREEGPTRDIGDTRVLAGWNTLPAGESATIELDLRITPENRGVYSTRVVVSALTPAGTGLGSDIDEIEANTLTRLSVQGEIGVAKQTIGEPSVRADGSVGVTYEILVENAGPFPLTNVEVHDQLSQAFGVGSTFVTSRVRIEANSPCEGYASSSYDGGTIDPVLISGVVLAPNESCRIQYDAVVIPSKALPGPFRSSAFAIASDPFSGTVIDDSTDGTNTDPDGNQEPGDNDIATAVRVVVPDAVVSMTATALDSGSLDNDDRFDFGYEIVLRNDGPIDITTTRLMARLDDAWSVPFEVLEVSSDDLAVNTSFNGADNTDLLERRNRLRAGESAVITLRLRATLPPSGELAAPIIFEGIAATQAAISVELDEPVVAVEPGQAASSGFLGSMSTEEKRMLALGSAATLLFAGIFIRRTVIRARRFKKMRAIRRAELQARHELFVDLRANAEARRSVRAHPPDIDLSDTDHPQADSVHHSPRRRRGRRPLEKQ